MRRTYFNADSTVTAYTGKFVLKLSTRERKVHEERAQCVSALDGVGRFVRVTGNSVNSTLDARPDKTFR